MTGAEAAVWEQHHSGPAGTGDEYARFFRLSGEMLCIAGIEGRFEALSPAWERTLGWRLDQLLTRSVLDFAHPEDRERTIAEARRVAAGAESAGFENRFRRADGSYLRLSWNATFSPDSGRFHAIAHDVTDIRRAEAALRDSEARFRAIFEHAGVGVATCDAEGRFLEANPAFLRMIGRRHDEVVGHPFRAFLHPEDAEAGARAFREAIADGIQVQAVEKRLVARDGGVVRAHVVRAFIRDDQDRVRYVIAVVEDVTKQRAAQQAIEALRRRNELILSSAAEGIYGIDAEGRVTFVNPAAARLVGWSPDALVGQHWHALIHHTRLDGRPFPEDECPIRRAVVDGRPCTVEDEVFWRPDGTAVPVEYTCRPIRNERGEREGAVVTFRDVAEQRAAREALARHAEELARSNKELEQFASVVSHDLQEPLRMVTSYLQLLERRQGDRSDERGRGYVRHAVEGAQRMRELIRDLLAYARVGSRAEPMVATPARAALAAALRNLAPVIEETGAEITHDPLPEVRADPAQLTRLFQNLVGNALKFRRPGERPRIHVGAAPRDGEWELRVRDEGIGFDPELAERLFEVFVRLHAADGYAGTGIGLAIAKKIIDRHGGRIWAESAPGRGATFYFTLPGTG